MRLAACLVLAACAAARADGPPTVVFLSDFGTRDDAVAICKGVILQTTPDVRVIDLTHEVPPFSVRDGARILGDTISYYPSGTVFLAVVDPGVGTTRKPIVVRTRRGHLLVLPDNGLATVAIEREGLHGAREITNARWLRASGRSSTFHGRDVFAPVAARLAHGADWTRVGPPVTDPVRLTIAPAHIENDVLRGEVVALDGPYGNLVTNVDAALFTQLGYALGDPVTLEVAGKTMTVTYARTFADVPAGTGLLFVDSRDPPRSRSAARFRAETTTAGSPPLRRDSRCRPWPRGRGRRRARHRTSRRSTSPAPGRCAPAPCA
jgi:hypothetical protein